MAFFRKADAKVRLFFEPPKLFEVFFENYFFSIGKVQNLISLPVFHYHRVSLSKAGAKLLLYSICSKHYRHFFITFLQYEA